MKKKAIYLHLKILSYFIAMLIFPNCKINIGLQIIAKRSDGYHDIATVFVPVYGLRDILEVQQSDTFSFDCSGRDATSILEDNLCIHAYHLLQQAYQLPPVKLYLYKNIPMGAGLGGGSADAAFTLLLLNRFFNLQLTSKVLKNYARKLGSDCVFFIDNKAAIGTGKGDELQHLVSFSLKGKYIYIIKPPIHINTAKAYAMVQASQPIIPLSKLIQQPIYQWKNIIVNDFEKYIFLHYPLLQEIKDKLYENGAIYASMSGSGSSLYGIFDDIPDEFINFRQVYFQWIGKL